MNVYDFVHLALFASGSEIRGKTKLQKRVYFAGILTNCVEELGYRPHFYGPYSSEVAGAVDRLRAIGFVDQSVATGSAYDQSGFELARYDFRLNSAGEKAAEAKSTKNPDKWHKIETAMTTLDGTGEEDYMKLSVAAKAYFMLGQKKEGASLSELTNLARTFGWSISDEGIREAAEFLQKLKLVEASD